jgi:transposase
MTPFVKSNKNDRNDAEAIAEAASLLTMRFVAVKTVEQQDIQALHRQHQLLVHQLPAIVNHILGILSERGIAIAQSPAALHHAMPEVLASDNAELTQFCRGLVVEVLQHLHSVEARIAEADQKIKAFMRSSALRKKIIASDDVGAVTATAIVAAVGDASEFKNGRHLAWAGAEATLLRGKSRLSGISKRGDKYLRTLLIHGARSVLRYAAGKVDAQSK